MARPGIVEVVTKVAVENLSGNDIEIQTLRYVGYIFDQDAETITIALNFNEETGEYSALKSFPNKLCSKIHIAPTRPHGKAYRRYKTGTIRRS